MTSGTPITHAACGFLSDREAEIALSYPPLQGAGMVGGFAVVCDIKAVFEATSDREKTHGSCGFLDG